MAQGREALRENAKLSGADIYDGQRIIVTVVTEVGSRQDQRNGSPVGRDLWLAQIGDLAQVRELKDAVLRVRLSNGEKRQEKGAEYCSTAPCTSHRCPPFSVSSSPPAPIPRMALPGYTPPTSCPSRTTEVPPTSTARIPSEGASGLS